MSAEVVCLASFNADLGIRIARPLRRGETAPGRGFSIGPGGKGSNAAVACARQGARVAVLACIGDDAHGALALRTWQAEGIDTEAVRHHADLPTGVALIQVFDDGDNAIAVAAGANAALDAAAVDDGAALIRGARVVMASCEVPLDAVQAAFALARAAGVVTLLNPAPAMPLPDALLALCDVLTPNRGELLALAGAPASSGDIDAAARALQARGAGTVVATLGPDGCTAWPAGGTAVSLQGHRVAVVDTIGAGDCFSGTLAAALARGLGWPQALRRANAAAALSTTGTGALGGMPSAGQVDQLLAGAAPA
ncbi:MAG: ribokinase [Aquabacterium sp.]